MASFLRSSSLRILRPKHNLGVGTLAGARPQATTSQSPFRAGKKNDLTNQKAATWRHQQEAHTSSPMVPGYMGHPELKLPLHTPSLSLTRTQHLAAAVRPNPSQDNRPRLVNMNQGEKVHAVFSKAEFDSRLSTLRQYMDENAIGACVFTSFHNINYYSGFMYCYFGRNYGLVVTQENATVVSAGIDGGQPWRRSLGADRCVTYTDWHRDNYFHAIQGLAKNCKGSVGLEFDHVSLEHQRKFDQALVQKKVDIGLPAMRLRLTKSPEEIKVIRHGARIADLGGEAVVAALRENVMESEVASAATGAMNSEINRTFPDCEQMDTWTWFQSGINTDGAHNPVTNRRVQKGDILSLNTFPMISGYYTALERTLFLDHASDEHIRLWEINCDVHRRGLELIRPGAQCCDIAIELNEIYKREGLLGYRSFGYGHSFGTLSHYYGREADLEIREDIETVLKPGMVVSMEPMIMIPEGQPGAGGYREHDILVVTEDGAENITKFPFGPEHNIIKAE